MKKVCKELVDFFQNEDGWDKDEIIAEYIQEVLKTFRPNFISPDEVSLCWQDDEFSDLQEFSRLFFEEVIKGVCNVIETA